MLPYILLCTGFILLIKGADFLVEGASSIAKRLNVSDLVIGLTVVAFGTSTPELFVNLIAAVKGNTGIAIGNVVGSNIANILLILGVSSMIRPLSAGSGTVWKEIPFGFLASLLLGILTADSFIDNAPQCIVSRSDGLVFLSFFMVFVYYSVGIAHRVDGMETLTSAKPHGIAKSLLYVVSGLIGLTVGGKWIVDGGAHIAESFGMSQTLVGLTIVAIGTSLPELATSAVAAKKGNVEIAVGNVIGSNIFNIFFVLGITSTVKPLPFQPKNMVDIGVMIGANVLLFISMFTGEKHTVDRWEGALFLLCYIGYIGFSIAVN